MLQFASQLVEAALTTAKQLWGTKTINTDSLLHPEPTCSLLRVPHREATPTSTITITVHVHSQRHTYANTHTAFLCHIPEFVTFPPWLWQRWNASPGENCHHASPCLLYINYTVISSLPYTQGWCLSLSVCTVGGPCVPRLAFSHRSCYSCVLLPFDAHFQDYNATRQTIKQTLGTHADSSHTLRLYTLTRLFHIAMLLMHPCPYSRSIWCMCQAWGGGLTDYIKLQCGKRAQRCQSRPCDGRSVEQ